MPGNGNGGGGSSFSTQSFGEGGQQPSGGINVGSWGLPKPPPPPPPKYGEPGYVAKPGEKGWVRKAKNVQRANIDRSSLYDPSAAGADYLQSRNASNPQPQGSTGAGAVGYEFTPSDERLY